MSSYGQFAYSYDHLTYNIDYEKRGRYFHNLMLQYGKESGILLDLACGTGSLSEYFARLNYDVIGIDASEEMLEAAMEKKMASGSNVQYIRQDMRELNLFGTVDIVLCVLDSLNHLIDEQELQAVLERVSLFLNEDALFVFDVNSVYKHEKVLGNHTFVYDTDDVYCVWQNRLKDRHIVEIALDLFEYQEEDDSYVRYQELFAERAYPETELDGYLEQAGFEIAAKYADDTLNAPAETSQRLIYVCRNKRCKNAAPAKAGDDDDKERGL